MVLSFKDGELFFDLFLPLLDYVNKKYAVVPEMGGIAKNRPFDLRSGKRIANRLWNETTLIDEYVALHDELEPEHKEILLSWKRVRTDRYILKNNFKSGSIFVGSDQSVYKVVGIKSSWAEMTEGFELPVYINTGLLPFRDVIISDGLMTMNEIYDIEYIRKDLTDTYLRAKKGGTIRTSL